MRRNDEQLPLDQPRVMPVTARYWRTLVHLTGEPAAGLMLDEAARRQGFDRWEVTDEPAR